LFEIMKTWSSLISASECFDMSNYLITIRLFVSGHFPKNTCACDDFFSLY
jgi:hypothetical protein